MSLKSIGMKWDQKSTDIWYEPKGLRGLNKPNKPILLE